MSRKSVLIAQLTEDEAIKDAFRQFAARIVNTSKLSSIKSSFPLENYMQSALNSGSDEEEEEDDDQSSDELCECKCQRNIKHKNTIVIKETNNQDLKDFKIKDKKSLKKVEKDMISFMSSHAINTQTNSNDNNNNSNEKQFNNNNNHSENCECIACEKIKKSIENANKLIADEEKKKRKSEKKKMQKKKKKNKRKAEKELNNSEELNDNKNEINIDSNEGINDKSKKDGKTDDNNKSLKENKKKNTNSNNKQNVKQKDDKEIDNKTNAKLLAKNSNRDYEKVSSNKSSPKSDRENDVSNIEAEEEELSFSSAYVSQIAQRKSKPSKTAQSLSEAQDYIHFDDNLKNSSNNYIINTNNSNDNNNYNTIKTVKEVAEELPKTKIIGEQKQKPLKIPKETKLQNIEKSIELAIVANQKAETHKFNEAIDLFSQALVFNPNDYRFYVNRSYCYDSIQDFRSALRDAEIAIQLRSDWPKCHYRKGKALAGLKNYQESEIALKKVLALEKDCDEALTELWHVRYGAIIDMGYDASAAKLYASQYDTIKDALDALSIRGTKNSMAINNKNNSSFVRKPIDNSWNTTKNGLLLNGFDGKGGEIWADDDIYISDDEYTAVVKDVEDFNSDDTSPTNPFGWKALWVGNVSLNAKLETLTTMFRKFGNLNYCNVFKGNNGGNFVLVHYDNPESPTLAMTKYKGKIIPGVSISNTALEIRFRPNKDQKKPNYDQRLESDECYYWRTTGCARGEKCLYKHIAANKGVDKQAWMCAPLKKGLPHNAKSLK